MKIEKRRDGLYLATYKEKSTYGASHIHAISRWFRKWGGVLELSTEAAI